MPPDYDDLPKPLSEEKIIDQNKQEIDLSKIFKKSKSKSSSDINKSLEDSINSIREKIGN
mgnify:CR=1 FL=1